MAAHTTSSAPHAAAGNRVLAAFAQLRGQGRRALLPFVTAGYPNLAATEAVLPRLARAGGAVIEVGIPFSDPIADGPVIAESMHEALVGGCTPAKVFESVRRVRAQVPAALVAMVSDSIVDRMGTEAFARAAAEAGFDGLIVPDIAGLACTLLVAPTSGPERVRRIVAECTGFVYALARVGITGERSGTPDVAPIVQRIRAATDLPVAVGFGLSSADQVRAVLQHADGAIVGSAIVRTMRDALAAGADPVAAAEALVQTLAAP
jgi:tryptophan synthase alpha chain